MNTKKIGDLGEKIAIDVLKAKGYEILEMNYRYRRSEIDVICLKDNLLIFVEVKALSHLKNGVPEGRVDHLKIRKIMEGAEHYIFAINWMKDIRFDILSIDLSDPTRFHHIEDAFY